MIARAEFFAPLILTCPERGALPQISKTDLSSLGVARVSVEPIKRVIVLSSESIDNSFVFFKFGFDSTGKIPDVHNLMFFL